MGRSTVTQKDDWSAHELRARNPAEAPAPHVTREKESVLSVSVLPRKRMGDEQHLRFLSRIHDPLKQ
jgi:hypothetical protein